MDSRVIMKMMNPGKSAFCHILGCANHTKKEVGTTSMRKVAVVVVGHIGHVQHVQLRFAAATSGIDREENRKGNQAADEARNDGHLKQAQEEEAIEGVVREDVTVGNFDKGGDPAEEAIGELGRALILGQGVQHGAGLVSASEDAAEEEEDDEEDDGVEEDGQQGGEELRGRDIFLGLGRANVGVGALQRLVNYAG